MSTNTYGPCFDSALDGPRIKRQIEVIRDVMLGIGEEWLSLTEIHEITGFPEASISSDLRHLRKSSHGSWNVEKQRRAIGGGLWEYRICGKRGWVQEELI